MSSDARASWSDREEGEAAHVEPQASAGNRESLEQLYERVAPALYAWASLRVRHNPLIRVEAEDLIQEAWVMMLRKLDRFDESRADFRSWMFGMLKRVLLEHLRRGSSSAAGVGGGASGPISQCPDSVTSITRALARDDAIRRFLEYTDTLAYEDRMVLVYHGLEDLPMPEVAARLSLSEEATRKRWQRLRAKLRERGVGKELVVGE